MRRQQATSSILALDPCHFNRRPTLVNLKRQAHMQRLKEYYRSKQGSSIPFRISLRHLSHPFRPHPHPRLYRLLFCTTPKLTYRTISPPCRRHHRHHHLRLIRNRAMLQLGVGPACHDLQSTTFNHHRLHHHLYPIVIHRANRHRRPLRCKTRMCQCSLFIPVLLPNHLLWLIINLNGYHIITIFHCSMAMDILCNPNALEWSVACE
jgi:hypothetical protein